ncbi:MAG: metallophosphoesterase, partial [bacterium]
MKTFKNIIIFMIRMLIGIISDTHDNMENVLKAFKYFNEHDTDLVLHCGDWVAPFILEASTKLNCPLKGVFGNNEGNRAPYYEKIKDENLDIEISDEGIWQEKYDGRMIAVTHGHQPIILKMLLESGKYDMVASGHTHEEKIEKHNKTLHINPGSVLGTK